MAEVFGDKADFAIEAGVEPDSHTHDLWGYMCVWCCGVPLGDLEERYCGLGFAYRQFVGLAERLDSLWAPELEGLDDVAAWNFLDGLLYGYYGDVELADTRTLAELRRDAARWGRFDFLTNWGEQFDEYKSFLLCPPGEVARVLSRRLPTHMGRGVSVSRQRLASAAIGFAAWFKSQSQRLGVLGL